MKKLSLSVVFALCFTGLNAQNLDFLNGEQKLHLVIEYKYAQIHGKTEEAFVQQAVAKHGVLWKEKWENTTKQELYQSFAAFFNRWTEKTGLQAGNFPEANYAAMIRITNIEKKGTTSADVLFSKTGSSEVIAVLSVQGRGGKYGSMENLAEDGFKRTGYNLGAIIASQVKSPIYPTVQTANVNTQPITSPTSDVKTYSSSADSIVFVKPQPSEIIYLRTSNERQLPRATLTLDAGYGWRIGKMDPDMDEFDEFIFSNLLNGFVWNAGIDFFFKDKFGVRMIFSQYRATYNTMATNMDTGKQGILDVKDAISYVGPAFVFRQPFGHNSWLFNAHAGFGYIEYRQKMTFTGEYVKTYGATLGSQMGAGIECKVSQNIGIGVNLLITSGVIQKFEYDANGQKTSQTLDIGKGEGLLQVKVGAGIRFYIK